MSKIDKWGFFGSKLQENIAMKNNKRYKRIYNAISMHNL